MVICKVYASLICSGRQYGGVEKKTPTDQSSEKPMGATLKKVRRTPLLI
jgi:hypothetical protein